MISRLSSSAVTFFFIHPPSSSSGIIAAVRVSHAREKAGREVMLIAKNYTPPRPAQEEKSTRSRSMQCKCSNVYVFCFLRVNIPRSITAMSATARDCKSVGLLWLLIVLPWWLLVWHTALPIWALRIALTSVPEVARSANATK
jgi:hypothetical protein